MDKTYIFYDVQLDKMVKLIKLGNKRKPNRGEYYLFSNKMVGETINKATHDFIFDECEILIVKEDEVITNV
jgi:hypothetical protein